MSRYLLIFLLFITVRGVEAQVNVGVVLASRGDVQLFVGEDIRILRQGDFIPLGGRVEAAHRGFVIIQLYDGTKLSLRPDSVLGVIEFDMSMADSSHILLSLDRGSVKVTAGMVAAENPGSFKILTSDTLLTLSSKEAHLGLCDETICEQSGFE